MQMKKEWQLTYDVLSEAMQERDLQSSTGANAVHDKEKMKFFAVYTTFTQTDKTPSQPTAPPPPPLVAHSEPPPGLPPSPTA